MFLKLSLSNSSQYEVNIDDTLTWRDKQHDKSPTPRDHHTEHGDVRTINADSHTLKISF